MHIDPNTINNLIEATVDFGQSFVAGYLDVILAVLLGVASTIATLRRRIYK